MVWVFHVTGVEMNKDIELGINGMGVSCDRCGNEQGHQVGNMGMGV